MQEEVIGTSVEAEPGVGYDVEGLVFYAADTLEGVGIVDRNEEQGIYIWCKRGFELFTHTFADAPLILFQPIKEEVFRRALH